MDPLWTLVVVLFILWLLGTASAYTAGGSLHFLLVIIVIIVLFRLLSGRSVP